MCGISGVYNLDKTPVSQKMLHGMDSVLKHRGPDGHGEFIERFIGLANRRLAIIDPGKRGNQPLSDPGGNYQITFNGEIFNYRELKEDLLAKGCDFRTETDTEVVLNSYIYFGPEAVTKFIGQFAFAIWDKKKEELFVARDHLGVNPLFYSLVGKSFIFASEVKALLASGIVKREVNYEALSQFLSVFTVPAPLSIIKGINSLLPGTYLKVNGNGIKQRTYWRLPENDSNPVESYGDAKNVLENLLEDCVKKAMVADVPVGAFLSGGIDSAMVVSLMSGYSGKKLKTYSLFSEGFGESFDERRYARLVSERYGTDHTEFTLHDRDLLKNLDDFIYDLDQPSGESLETYFLSKVIGREVKVALSGIGGDEIFAGYHGIIHATRLAGMIYSRMPRVLKSLMNVILNASPLDSSIKHKTEIAGEFLDLGNPLLKRFFLYFVFREEEKKKLLNSEIRGKIETLDTGIFYSGILAKSRNFSSEINKLAYLDLSAYTRDNLLGTANIASMAHSLELRVPLLDWRLVEYSFRLPDRFKLRHGISKYIFRDIAKSRLPPEILSHKKTGFGMPRIKYMHGILKPLILDALSEKSVKSRGLLNPGEVDLVLKRFYLSKQKEMLWTEHLRVWILFIFELWAREYLD